MEKVRAMETFSKIKPQSRADLVVDKITNSIIINELSDGELLPPENKLCEMFGVSRSILREAIRVLASKGLVKVRQGYGTLVCMPKVSMPEEAFGTYLKTNPLSVSQIMEIRTPIEIEVARLAAERRQDIHLKRMESSLQMLHSPMETIEAYVNADHEFHTTMIEATGNPLFGIVIRSIMRYLDLTRQLVIRHFGLAVVIQEHQVIFEAVKNQDATSAVTTMRNHMKGAFSRINEVNKLLHKRRNNNELC
jgi:GntR family transcriptional repressor for pyruvate dehydrogenase complex